MTAIRAGRARRLRNGVLVALAVSAVTLTLPMSPRASASGSTTLIQGSGSSWAANAVNQWISDVQANNGLQVVFTSVGSAQGRKDFANDITDFAVSDIGYQGVDPVTGASDTSQGRSYAYVPIVAGGTSFPYQIRVAGQQLTNLRLSGLTLAKIFTNVITNWDDPAVTADNNGRQLPSLPIIPVVHSEGSGSTAQFTTYLNTEYQSLWQNFSHYHSFTEYWPQAGSQQALNGSDSVMNFISSSAGNGSIGYDEYSYALNKGYPVAKLENSAGYFTAPTQYNVAVALTQAQINQTPGPNYLLQNLTNVYTYRDQRTYPLSSYSYGIIPTGANDQRMTTAKRQTIVDYLLYSTCQGQAEMGPIGYSSLPINLVQAAFNQIALLGKVDSHVDVSLVNVRNCGNPTFDSANPNVNCLALHAPPPPACDRAGSGPCPGSEGLFNGGSICGAEPVKSPGTQRSGGSSGSGGGGGSGGSGGSVVVSTGPGSGGSGSSSFTGSTGSTASSGKGAGTAATSIQGAPLGTNTSGSTVAPSQAPIIPTVTLIAVGSRGSLDALWAALAALGLGLALMAPPLLARWRARREVSNAT